MQGFISVLMDVVKYDSKYYNVVSNQVGNVLLVDNIDNANKISKVINQRYKIVTLDGDIVHIGGTMTGGSLNTSKSIFEEKHELETLRVKRREIAEVIATLEENITSLMLESPLSDFTDCSPRTHLTASTILLLPLPFGPTIHVVLPSKEIVSLSAKDLNPVALISFKYILSHLTHIEKLYYKF